MKASVNNMDKSMRARAMTLFLEAFILPAIGNTINGQDNWQKTGYGMEATLLTK